MLVGPGSSVEAELLSTVGTNVSYRVIRLPENQITPYLERRNIIPNHPNKPPQYSSGKAAMGSGYHNYQ